MLHYCRPQITLESMRGIIAKPYPAICSVIASGGRFTCNNKRVRGSYFCSALAGKVLQQMGVMAKTVGESGRWP